MLFGIVLTLMLAQSAHRSKSPSGPTISSCPPSTILEFVGQYRPAVAAHTSSTAKVRAFVDPGNERFHGDGGTMSLLVELPCPA